jgi:hypothetical protein
MKNAFNKTGKALLAILLLVSNIIFYGCEDELAPPAVIQFSESTQSVAEGGETMITITFNRAAPQSGSINLNIKTNAIYDQHYVTDLPSKKENQVITIEKGQKMLQFKITTINNDQFDNGKFIILELDNPSEGLTLGSVKLLAITLIDDEGPSIADFERDVELVDELDVNGTEVKLPLSAPAKGTGRIIIDVSSSAVYGKDFITSPEMENNTITRNILPGESDANFKVIPIHNFNATENQQVSFKISSTEGVVQKGKGLNHLLTIINEDDQALVNFATSSGTVEENNASGIIVEIPLTIPALGEGSITISAFPRDLDTFTTDPAQASNGTFTLPVPNHAEKVSFKVFPLNNSFCFSEFFSKTVSFKIVSVNGSVKMGIGLEYGLTIMDDEVHVLADFETIEGSIQESNSDGIQVKLNFSKPLSQNTIISLTNGNCDFPTKFITEPPTSNCDYYYNSTLALNVSKDQTSAQFKIHPLSNSLSSNLLVSYYIGDSYDHCIHAGTNSEYTLTIVNNN